MSTTKIRIEYEVLKKQLDEANKALKESEKRNNLVQKEVDETTEKFKKQDKTLSKTNQSLKGLGGQLTQLGNRFTIAGKGAGDMAAGLFATNAATNATSKSMKILKFAIASTGIGLLVVGLASLVSFFTKTQRGADILSKAMAGLGAAVDVLVDRASALGESIFNAFKNPQQAIKDLGNIIVNNIINRFKAVSNLVSIAGDAISALADGDLAGLKKSAEDAGQALIQMSTGLDVDQQSAIAASISSVTDEINKEAKAASLLQGRRNKLRDAEIAFIETKSKLRKEIAESRLAAEEEKREEESLAEANARRFEVAQKGIDAQNKLSDIEIGLAKEKAAILQAEIDLGETLTEGNRELAQAKANIIDLDTARDETLKRLLSRQNAFNETKKGEVDITNDLKEAEEELNIFRLEQGDLLLEAELARRAILLENEELNIAQRQLILEESEAKIAEIKQDNADKEAEATEKQNELNKLSARIKQDLATQTLGLVIDILGKESIAGKAAAIGQATINVAQGITQALATLPPPASYIAAAITGATGAVQIAKIAGVATFEEGGKIGGEYHSAPSGGTHILAERDEFVMSRKATSKYGFDFMDKVNGLELDPNILGGKSGGASINVIDTNPIAEQLKNMPQNIVNIDSEGYTAYQVRGQRTYAQKANRYSTR